MRTLAIAILILLSAGYSALEAQQKYYQTVQNRRTLTVRYTGNINGAQALAVATYEQMREYVLAAGGIDSNGYRYTFTAEIFSGSGYGEMVSLRENTRFRIKVDVAGNRLAITANPHGPGTPTTYYFQAN